jgi:hypothetical protein
MNRKLWALNVALALAAVYAGYQLQQEWAAKRAREQAAARIRFQAVPQTRFTAQPVPPPVLPATYSNIAQKFLLDRSRNPDVIVPPPPPPPAPPPIVVPPLPGFHGEMNLDGPTALLSLGGGMPDAIHPGEMIGPFKLIDVNRTDIVFEWNGQLIKKSVDEILVKPAAQVAANSGAAAAPPVAQAAPPPAPKALGPGESTQFGFKTCQQNDNLPEGTVQDGYRKTYHKLPFGTSCTWDPVGGVPGK